MDFSAGLPERGDMTFAVILHEGTDGIDLVYASHTGNMRSMGYGALVGMQDSMRAMVGQFACDNGAPRLASGDSVRFTPL